MISDMIFDIILISQGWKTILLSCNLEHKRLKLKKNKNKFYIKNKFPNFGTAVHINIHSSITANMIFVFI